MTVDVGGTVQNPGLVADLCKIIERQSQEIANLVHINAPLPVENAPLQPHMSLQITELGRGLDKVCCFPFALDAFPPPSRRLSIPKRCPTMSSYPPHVFN